MINLNEYIDDERVADMIQHGEYDSILKLFKEIQEDAYLSALKDTEIRMSILSDNTTFTQGYKNLQERIKRIENVNI